jgi:hypothetical protein
MSKLQEEGRGRNGAQPDTLHEKGRLADLN